MLFLIFNRHQLADVVLKITFSVSKIVGNVSYQINLAKYRIMPNVAGRRRTLPDVFADVAGIFKTSPDVFQMSPDVLGTFPDAK